MITVFVIADVEVSHILEVPTNIEACQEFQNTPDLLPHLQFIQKAILAVALQEERDIPTKQVSVKLLGIVLTISPIHFKKILILLHLMTKVQKKVQESLDEVLQSGGPQDDIKDH